MHLSQILKAWIEFYSYNKVCLLSTKDFHKISTKHNWVAMKYTLFSKVTTCKSTLKLGAISTDLRWKASNSLQKICNYERWPLMEMKNLRNDKLKLSLWSLLFYSFMKVWPFLSLQEVQCVRTLFKQTQGSFNDGSISSSKDINMQQ